MLITAMDSRNMNLVMDNRQAKMLVEILRRAPTEAYIGASQALQKHGYQGTMGDDALNAARAFIGVVGYITDMMVVQAAPQVVVEPAIDAETAPNEEQLCDECAECAEPPTPAKITVH